MRLVKVAIATMRSSNNKAANLATMELLIREASSSYAKMVFFPEVASFMSTTSAETKQNADLLTGPTVSILQNLAKIHNIWISSCLYEQPDSSPLSSPPDSRVYNTQIIISNTGELTTTYRKIHLFDISLPEKNINLLESKSIRPGSKCVVAPNSPLGPVGLAICYDLRFPELASKLASLGAHVITYPSAFTVPTGQAHWHVLLRARAIENQSFVIAAAQYGKCSETRNCYGHSLVVDPWGEIIYDGGGADDSTEEQDGYVGFCEIDLDAIDDIREKMPIKAHRDAAVSWV